MSRKMEIFTDGACSGNPGLAGIGVVLLEEGEVVKELSVDIGHATNNIAEYMAVIYGLQEAHMLRSDEIVLYSDSELVCRQLEGIYQVKQAHIKPLFGQVRHLLSGFSEAKIQHIPRERNKAADQLARKAIKKEQVKVVAPARIAGGEESPSSKG